MRLEDANELKFAYLTNNKYFCKQNTMSRHCLLYHIVYRTKGSEMTINELRERELYGYINGMCKNKGCKLFRIGGMPDHIHMLVSIPPDIAISKFVQVIKTESSKWLKLSSSFPLFRGWADGYAVFSYAHRDKEIIRNYIINQKVHHQSKSFRDEYLALLAEFGENPSDDRFLDD